MNLAEYDSHRQTADTKSGPVGYTDVGSGRPALFVHGVGTSGLLWRNVIGALKDERRCIALDLLRDMIPGATGVVTIDGGRLFFPDERAADLVTHLRSHWTAHSTV